MNREIGAILARGPVIPVVTLADAALALPVADALADGGIGVVEITLRTPAGLDAIRAIAAARPELAVGAGTCLTGADLVAAREAGAHFAVSPGVTPTLLGEPSPLPLMPGVATVSDAMRLLEGGFQYLKFFPAAAVGGTTFLKAVAPVLPGLHFCPTGGITLETAPDYLALPNVPCVGGGWIAPPSLIEAGDRVEIARRARAASALGPKA